jgi:putative ATP-dependent endonuclease of OLD family
MKITRLEIQNYRSVENLSLSFPTYYSAICGKNNAGKTNILKAVRVVLREQSPFVFDDSDKVAFKEDFPMWKAKEREKGEEAIRITLNLTVEHESDTELYKFVEKFASIPADQSEAVLRITVEHTGQKSEALVLVEVNGTELDEYSAREILKKVQTSSAILFHNSTEMSEYGRYAYRRAFGGFLREFSHSDKEKFEKMQTQVNGFVGRLAKQHQRDITELLGKLEEKYEVGLSVPNINLEFLPFDMSLVDKGVSVPLKDWGSGTRNRTEILLTLLKAKKISESQQVSNKITPILIVEEPESFLHPSAQAEFGRVLQDLAEEFRVQVITTTHSPYMLSMDKPESNVLLERKTFRKQLKSTEVVDTSGEEWMKPFGLALGIDNGEFEPWKHLLFSKGDSILLVEGDIDKEYFELLRKPEHGQQRLQFEGEVFAYGGKDTLRNSTLLRFIMNRYEKFYITFDLDCQQEVRRTLEILSLENGKHYSPVGIDAPGKKDIEGLLPDSIRNAVYTANSDLVQQAMSSNTEERKSAKNRFKQLFLREFKQVAKPGREYYQHFYPLVNVINRALASNNEKVRTV